MTSTGMGSSRCALVCNGLRGVFTIVLLVSTVLSPVYVLLGVPHGLLLGPFSGLIEIVPIVGPLLAGGAAIGLAITVSWTT